MKPWGWQASCLWKRKLTADGLLIFRSYDCADICETWWSQIWLTRLPSRTGSISFLSDSLFLMQRWLAIHYHPASCGWSQHLDHTDWPQFVADEASQHHNGPGDFPAEEESLRLQKSASLAAPPQLGWNDRRRCNIDLTCGLSQKSIALNLYELLLFDKDIPITIVIFITIVKETNTNSIMLCHDRFKEFRTKRYYDKSDEIHLGLGFVIDEIFV